VIDEAPDLRDAGTAPGINVGLAIVVPVRQIIETLHHPRLVQMRKDAAKDIGESGLPVDDSAVSPATPRPGPEPERLKIKGPMDRAVKRMFKKGKPPKGA
jgi:hypothetical protein